MSHGAVMPSTSFLARDMLGPVQMKKGVVIVELGAGTGAFTREILTRLPSDGKLLVIELNPTLVAHLKKKLNDPRVVIIEGDAAQLGSYLREEHCAQADYIISGLPIGNFRYAVRHDILSAIHSNLSDAGRYIQFQYFLASLRHVRRMFDTKIIAPYSLRMI